MEYIFTGFFRDRRLEARGHQIVQAISEKKVAIANRYCQNATEEMGNRRFMSNPRIDNPDIQKALAARCREQAAGKVVLNYQDTTEINYQSHAGRLSKDDPHLGPVGNGRDFGFFAHVVLAVDAASGFPLGFPAMQTWSREWEPDPSRDYKSLTVEEKESYRWIACAEQAKACLAAAERCVIIGDRESDIYEVFARVPDARCDVLVRCAQDRRLVGREESLFAYLAALPVRGEMTATIRGNKQRKNREARLEIRFGTVRIARPARRGAESGPAEVEIQVIEIREKAESVPAGEEPIRWRLAATLPIARVAEAEQAARWYAGRWWIEELFRTLKREGLNVEAAQYESGRALQRLVHLALQAALRILQLTRAREGDYPIPPEAVFTPEELVFQEKLLPRVEGKTAKQKNPFPRTNLAWSAWIIARLGGWKTVYAKKAPPGVITMKRGLECFYQLFAGWQIATSLGP